MVSSVATQRATRMRTHSCAIEFRPLPQMASEILNLQPIHSCAGIGKRDRLCEIVVVRESWLGLDFRDPVRVVPPNPIRIPAELKLDPEQIARRQPNHRAAGSVYQFHIDSHHSLALNVEHSSTLLRGANDAQVRPDL